MRFLRALWYSLLDVLSPKSTMHKTESYEAARTARVTPQQRLSVPIDKWEKRTGRKVETTFNTSTEKVGNGMANFACFLGSREFDEHRLGSHKGQQ